MSVCLFSSIDHGLVCLNTDDDVCSVNEDYHEVEVMTAYVCLSALPWNQS